MLRKAWRRANAPAADRSSARRFGGPATATAGSRLDEVSPLTITCGMLRCRHRTARAAMEADVRRGQRPPRSA